MSKEKGVELVVLLMASGNSVMAEVRYPSESEIQLRNPVILVPQRNEQQQMFAQLVPFFFGSKLGTWITFAASTFLATSVPDPTVVADYKNAFAALSTSKIEVMKTMPGNLKVN